MTILIARGAGDPERVEHVIRILRHSTLGEVAAAIAAYSASVDGAVYVERIGDLYRWSPTSRGGAYPLLRLLARFLRCEHTELTVGFVTVDEWCVAADPDEPRSDHFAILEAPSCDPEHAAAMIGVALGRPGS